MNVLIKLTLLACLVGAGLVLGFCVAGFYGVHFDQPLVHRLGDLAYLFDGAMLFAVGSAMAAIWALYTSSRSLRRRVAAFVVPTGTAAAGATWVIANLLR